MAKIKKMTAVLLSVVMLVCCFGVQAGAANVFDGAKKIEPMQYYEALFENSGKDYYYYKIVLPSSGEITFRVEEGFAEGTIYNSRAEEIAVTSNWNGVYSIEFKEGSSWKISDLKKGTYYLKLSPNYRRADAKNFYYIFTPDNKPTISLALNVKVGDELDFSALATNYTGKATWKTTKSAVATVKNGKVTAVAVGTAKIRAYMSNGDYAEITIKVKKK